MERRAGFEPATTRIANEVTAIFTADRDGSRRGISDAVAALSGEPPFGARASNPLGAFAPSHEVTGIFTTALPMQVASCSASAERHAGEQAISVFSDGSTVLLAKNCAVARGNPREAPPQCVRQRRDSNPLYQSEVSEIFTTSVGEPQRGGKPDFKKVIVVRRYRRAANCELRRVRSAIGVRLIASFPPAGPARLGARVAARAPGSGSPVPALRRVVVRSAVSRGNKKPSGAVGSGGSTFKRTIDLAFTRDRSHEPGMRYRLAGGHSIAASIFHVLRASQAHVGSRT